MSCTDEDTSFEGNNATCFESNGGAGVTVTEDGSIVLLSRPPLDTTYTTTAYCRDRCTSTSPTGQLRSSGRTVTVYTTECTTTIITDTPTTEETTLTTTAETTTVTIATTTPLSTENVSSWADKNVWWIALAALLGTALLGLLMYMWLMYCWKHCGQCLERQWCQRKLPEPRRTRMKQPIRAESPPRVHYPTRVHTPPTRVQTPLRRLTPSEKPTRPSPPPTPPPPPPAIVGDPNARGHDFWKERYPDDDYSNLPDRKDNPRPVTP
ncbi:uncharacterized protein DDB_G0290587-like [Littorina saxatilis]|uniref:uncharacterized protein DDB_G0290587-like n=1 Tax=Littorina saxatilis TaxID=31220 RepID=UPI0038B445B3